MDNALGQVLAIFTGLLTVAIVALFLKNNAGAQVIQTFTSGFGQDLSIATLQSSGNGLGTTNTLGNTIGSSLGSVI